MDRSSDVGTVSQQLRFEGPDASFTPDESWKFLQELESELKEEQNLSNQPEYKTADLRRSGSGSAVPQDLKTCTARITNCLQMGHSLILLPHLVQVTM